jgi:hypothetical protein
MVSSMVLTPNAVTPTIMWRRDKNGTRFQAEPQREEYSTPVKGTYLLELTGIAEPFEMDNHFKPGEKVLKTRIEFTVKRSRNGLSDGKRFTGLYTWSLGKKSNMGALMNAITPGGMREGDPVRLTNKIGTTFKCFVTNSDDGKYAGVSVETIETVTPPPYPDEPLEDEPAEEAEDTPEDDAFWQENQPAEGVDPLAHDDDEEWG